MNWGVGTFHAFTSFVDGSLEIEALVFGVVLLRNRVRRMQQLVCNPEGPYTLLLWNQALKDHPHYGFGDLIPQQQCLWALWVSRHAETRCSYAAGRPVFKVQKPFRVWILRAKPYYLGTWTLWVNLTLNLNSLEALGIPRKERLQTTNKNKA